MYCLDVEYLLRRAPVSGSHAYYCDRGEVYGSSMQVSVHVIDNDSRTYMHIALVPRLTIDDHSLETKLARQGPRRLAPPELSWTEHYPIFTERNGKPNGTKFML